MPPLTLTEKIATRYAVALKPGQSARQGRIIRIRPKHVMTHDNTGAVIPKFQSIWGRFEGRSALRADAQHAQSDHDAIPTECAPESARRADLPADLPRIHDPHQPVFAIDHDIQNHSPENLAKYAKIQKFADRHAVDFYPAGTGISHQVMVEQGYAIPGAMVVGSDSHSNLYGGVSALGTPVVRTDAACIWATGQTWWQVPKVARCELKGKLQPGVVGKDAIIALCGLFNNDEVLNHSVEFVGEGVNSLSMDQRLSIANMTTEWGALAGIFPFDEILRDYLLDRADYLNGPRRPGTRRDGSLGTYTRDDVNAWWSDRLEADEDAPYAIDLELDLSTVIPHVSGPNHVKVMTSLPEMEAKHVPIQKAYLLSCVNARLEDLAEAAAVVKNKKVAKGVEFYVAAASADVQAKAEQLGHWQALVSAGAITLPSGCGPCIGLGKGTVNEGEVAISATNRNFKGRMGSRDAEVYLASPAVVAASAIAGHICAPTRFEDTKPKMSVHVRSNGRPEKAAGEILEGFPASIKGRCLLLPQDNLNTDGIYAGKWTSKDDMTPQQKREVIFENYDPAFNDIYQDGDIIVGARNFGTGSSREQAATALKYRGIPCVIAASFSETYRRNAFNNGFLCVECPDLVDHLLSSLAPSSSGTGVPPVRILTIPGPTLEVDFENSEIRTDGRVFPFPQLSTVAQELVVAGGAEAIAAASLA